MNQITTSRSDEISPVFSLTSKGAIELGLENQIRTVCKLPKFEAGITETIRTIWTHYCGANPEYLTPEFEKEAIELIKKKFAMLGVNEIKEAFRLASTNVINADMRAFSGRINIQVIGNVLSSYVNYRNPILSQILKERETEQTNNQIQEQQEKRAKYKKEVIDWFNSKPSVKSWNDVRFYQFDVLEQEGIICLEKDQIHDYLRKAKVIIDKQKEDAKKGVKDLHQYRKMLSSFESTEKAQLKNIAKELALFDAINKNY
jgi:hypothetical protein